jgi:hypothetical protein
MLKKYLVCREDKLGDRLKSSGDYLPKVVEATDPHSALWQVFDSYNPDYRPMNKSYLVVELIDAVVITLKPKPSYEIETERYS